MFGSNTVQSSWANPQQNQQNPQQSGSAFGQPSAFGTGGGKQVICLHGVFAPINPLTAFGQPQQPQANPMFGNLGTSTTGTSAFGVPYRISHYTPQG